MTSPSLIKKERRGDIYAKKNIDTYHFIASLLVVAIHIYPLTSINENLDYLFSRVFCRIAVPFFLMLTGYFVISKSVKEKEVLKKYSLKIAKIYFLSILIYLPLNFYNHYFRDTTLLNIIKDIFFNGTFYHLWYFPALLLGIWITYGLLKIKNNPLKISLFLLLYILGLMGDTYYGFIKNISFLENIYSFIFHIFDYTRNGLFYAPIFLGMGYFIAKQEEKQKYLTLKITFFLICMMIEGALLYFYQIPRHSSMYLFLLPVSYFLFCGIMSKEKSRDKKRRNLATCIYIMHPWFIVMIRFVSKFLHLEPFLVENSILNYIAVVLGTIFFLLGIRKIKESLPKKKTL